MQLGKIRPYCQLQLHFNEGQVDNQHERKAHTPRKNSRQHHKNVVVQVAWQFAYGEAGVLLLNCGLMHLLPLHYLHAAHKIMQWDFDKVCCFPK